MKKYYAFVLLSIFCIATAIAQISNVITEEYTWQSVPITGGGFVPGIIFSPSKQGVRYCRTDMGGAYRWNDVADRWEQLLDFLPLSDGNLQGVESIAIDPNDANHVMMACGTSSRAPGAILVSHDGFKTFRRTDVPFGLGGNENGRGNGERMMISPQDNQVAYIGTRNDGLWRTTDDGLSWHRVTNFPEIKEEAKSWSERGSGVICTLFDGQDIYAAVSAKDHYNIYRSSDQGSTWQVIDGQPTALRPTHMVISPDRKLYISYADTPGPSDMSDGAVWTYDIAKNVWRDITPFSPNKDKGEPLGFGYAAVAVDSQHPLTVIASTHGLWGKYGFGDEELFLSQDGGRNWTPVFNHGYRYDCTEAPYAEMAPLHWMFDIEIDPFDSQHAIVTTGFGGWETFNLLDCMKRNGEVVWQIMAKGIEETVPLEMYCPPTGARLMVGIGDYGGFTFDDITRQVATGSNFTPHFANTDGISGAWQQPQLAVRVGEVFHGTPDRRPVSYSEDGGHTWHECASHPEEGARNGHISVSALGSAWIWTPSRNAAYRTTDKGVTWTKCIGLPNNIRTIADKENDDKFYAVDVVGRKLYLSDDCGITFVCDSLQLVGAQPMPMFRNMLPQSRGDHRGGQDRVYATPGHEGDLWIAAYDGLYRLQLEDTDFGGGTLLHPEAFSGVRTLYAFGFGKGLTDEYPAIYIIGVVNGEYGFFRSDDAAHSWVRINDQEHQYGHVLHITGDMQEYGRVYIGTHGRGVITGISSSPSLNRNESPFRP